MMRYKQNKQKENENVWAQIHTPSRVCEWIKNEVVGGVSVHTIALVGDHH